MPFKSEAQRRLFHAKADRGEISKETVSEWEHSTKNKKALPMHVKKEAYYAAGHDRALRAFGLAKTANEVVKTIVGGAGKAMQLGGKVLGAAPSGVGNIAGGIVGGIGGGLAGAVNAAPGDRMRQMGIGAVSGAAGGALPGGLGFVADPLINAGLQKATEAKTPAPPMQQNPAQQKPVMQPTLGN